MKKVEDSDKKLANQRDLYEDYDSKDYYREKYLKPKLK